MNNFIRRREFLQRSSVVAASLAGLPWIGRAGEKTAAARSVFNIASVRKPLAAFAIVTDTHYAVRSEGKGEHRYLPCVKQTMSDMEAAGADFVLHLGDLVNSFPSAPEFEAEVKLARDHLSAFRTPIFAVPGNHDVGHKPSMTAPKEAANKVRQEWVEAYLKPFKTDYQLIDRAGLRIILLNAMLFNSGLPREREQWDRLRDDLAGAKNAKIILGFHVPLFWYHPDDTGPDNYEVIDEPVRGHLLELIRKYKIKAVFTGHTHQPIINTYGDTLLLTAPSTTFARTHGLYPGQRELTTDPAKRGYLLVRVYEDDFIINRFRPRTAPLPDEASVVLPRQSAENARCHLATMIYAPRLFQAAQAQPSQQKALSSAAGNPRRLDNPLLEAADLGVRYVRVVGAINTPDYVQALMSTIRLGQRPVMSLPPQPEVAPKAIAALGKFAALVEAPDPATFKAALKAAGNPGHVMLGPVPPEKLTEALAAGPVWVSVLLDGAGKSGRDLARQAREIRMAHPKNVFWFDILNGPSAPDDVAKLFLMTYGLGIIVNPVPMTASESGTLLDRNYDPTPAHRVLRTLSAVLGEARKHSDLSRGSVNWFWFPSADGRFVEALWSEDRPSRVSLGAERAGAFVVDLATGLSWPLPKDNQVNIGKLPILVCKL